MIIQDLTPAVFSRSGKSRRKTGFVRGSYENNNQRRSCVRYLRQAALIMLALSLEVSSHLHAEDVNTASTACSVIEPKGIISYEGDCANGLAHGKGVALAPSAQNPDGYYVGNFVAGNIHGEAVYHMAKGNITSKEWYWHGILLFSKEKEFLEIDLSPISSDWTNALTKNSIEAYVEFSSNHPNNSLSLRAIGNACSIMRNQGGFDLSKSITLKYINLCPNDLLAQKLATQLRNEEYSETVRKKKAASKAGKRVSVTLRMFYDIDEGMAYSEVIEILGSPHEKIASNEFKGFPGVMPSIYTSMYQWYGKNGGNMNATFQNGRLVGKAQFGLR